MTVNDRIKEAFSGIRAEDELKEKTKRAVAGKIGEAERRKNVPRRRKPLYLSIAFCFALLAVFGGYRLYFVPTSVISIDINPSVELDVNRFDRIVGVEGYNEDGEELSESADVMYMNYSSALDEILGSEAVTKCLAEGEYLSITVIPGDEAQGEAILSYASACTDGQENAHCYSADREEVEHAHSLGLSYGKYRVYEEIVSCCGEDAVTAEEAGEMTMRQLRDYLAAHGHTESTLNTENTAAAEQNAQLSGQQSCTEHDSGEVHGNGSGGSSGKRHGHEQE